jgi:hypothetical protein
MAIVVPSYDRNEFFDNPPVQLGRQHLTVVVGHRLVAKSDECGVFRNLKEPP